MVVVVVVAMLLLCRCYDDVCGTLALQCQRGRAVILFAAAWRHKLTSTTLNCYRRERIKCTGVRREEGEGNGFGRHRESGIWD